MQKQLARLMIAHSFGRPIFDVAQHIACLTRVEHQAFGANGMSFELRAGDPRVLQALHRLVLALASEPSTGNRGLNIGAAIKEIESVDIEHLLSKGVL